MPKVKAASASALPPLVSYAEAASRTALSMIVAEAHEPGGERTEFEAVERSASEALLDVFSRFMRSLGGAARSAAQHAGRSESNLADLLVGINAVSPDGAGLSVPELRSFLEEAPEVAFPVNVSTFPVPRPPPSASAAAAAATAVSADPRPAHVPDFLPPFPEKRLYSHTVTYNSRPVDVPAAKKRRAKNRRHAQDSLLNLADAMRGGSANSATEGTMPPPPLPALPDKNSGSAGAVPEAMREDGADGGFGGSASSAGLALLRSVPDVLVPSMPAVLQSSARRLETSGLVDAPAFGEPLPAASAQAAAGIVGNAAVANAVANAPPRQKAILGLKHLHGLDGLDDARGRRGAGGGGDDDD